MTLICVGSVICWRLSKETRMRRPSKWHGSKKSRLTLHCCCSERGPRPTKDTCARRGSSRAGLQLLPCKWGTQKVLSRLSTLLGAKQPSVTCRKQTDKREPHWI